MKETISHRLFFLSNIYIYTLNMKNMEQLFKSILDQDKAPIVVCDMNSIIVYMNPSAITRYKKDLTGKILRNCHPEDRLSFCFYQETRLKGCA